MKRYVDIESGWLRGFPKIIPDRFLDEKLEVKDWKEFREWVLLENKGQEFSSMRMWFSE